jgi:hypothetical protein
MEESMGHTDESTVVQTTLSLAEERLRLEREAIAVERERLAAARAHAEAEAKLVRARRRPFLTAASILLLGAVCFAGGLLTGISVMENRQQRLRDVRLAQALSKLGNLSHPASSHSTNSVLTAEQKTEALRNVSVLVIQ